MYLTVFFMELKLFTYAHTEISPGKNAFVNGYRIFSRVVYKEKFCLQKSCDIQQEW